MRKFPAKMYFRLSALAAVIHDAFGTFKKENIRRMRATCKVKCSLQDLADETKFL